MSDYKRHATVGSSYQNYRIARDTEIDQLSYENSEPAPAEFYANYVNRRCPVKLTGFPGISGAGGAIDVASFMPGQLQATLAYTGELQVEKKFKHGFGSGQERLKMPVGKLMDLFKEGSGEYYLTTQYEHEDEEEEGSENESENVGSGDEIRDENDESSDDEDDDSIDMNNLHDDFEDDNSSIDMNDLRDDFEDDNTITPEERTHRIRELLQPPLTNLIHKPDILPLVPNILSKLIPQQINLWMGQSGPTAPEVVVDPSDKTCGLGKYIPGTRGSSSGLHHDHADNLYILVCGKKRFTLFSPADALKLYTVGEIYKVYNSGIIDYETNERAPNWRHIRDDGAIIEEVIRWQLDQLEDTDADSEKHKQLLKQLDFEHKRSRKVNSGGPKLDPPNFSTIPPGLLHIDEFQDPETRKELVQFAHKHFPGFLELNRFTVWLEPGDMLYLPAGWFHEVSSFGEDDKDNVHVALNYWFIPPNTDDPARPYSDEYWTQDWERTQECIEGERQLGHT
ncbi:Clavaminate synthase-like protein [Suhomyces tanzawaensis NRRL Y-17324]|uniref:Clavaminate synthase-like protein n=1 Tax=Suhomyces tanzawaensis NRRL Y-17324 TaxID=984487 RepID=A0A1E4SQ36_9ASCO|nr:Clavaminate synthase-like protein [Suhomyces tanzawaensis NRRL Y-17324]ODV81609.1 Clavaminate synthase-like protein [Suhomyces tanzawaensis NRRL Y-17324]